MYHMYYLFPDIAVYAALIKAGQAAARHRLQGPDQTKRDGFPGTTRPHGAIHYHGLWLALLGYFLL
jgi:hypothetical protein